MAEHFLSELWLSSKFWGITKQHVFWIYVLIKKKEKKKKIIPKQVQGSICQHTLAFAFDADFI